MKICLSLLAALTALAADTPETAVSQDRVGFPKDYATKFSILRTTIREDGAKIVTVYGNPQAATITNKTQLPYPYGSIIVMETAATRKNGEGKPLKDAKGDLQKQTVLGMHVMRKQKGFGEKYADNRSGEWEFVEYKADGTFLTPPQKSAACAECHIKAGSTRDFVYHGRFSD
jgi:hypothetical protein